MFQEHDEVEITDFEYDSRLVIDQAPPFNGRWAVHGIPGILTANSGGFYAHELRKTGNTKPRR